MTRLILSLVGMIALVVTVSTVPILAQDVSTLAKFNPSAGELPEGLAVDRQGNFYVGMALTGEIKKVTPNGQVSTFATLSSPGDGLLIGIAFDRLDNLYVALASFDPKTHGIWRVSQDRREVELFAPLQTNEEQPDGLPNFPAFDKRGNLYVSDSIGGKVWKIDQQGRASTWKQDPLLVGEPPVPGQGHCPPSCIPIGANGIAFDHEKGHLYVANTDFGRIVRIGVAADGSAGAAEIFVEDGNSLGGPDGIAFDNQGNLYVALALGDRLVRISPKGQLTTLAEGAPLQMPASLAFGAEREKKNLYITNFAFLQFLGARPGNPEPALLKLPVGIPGRPLPQ